MDILALGVNFRAIGSPRHSVVTNTVFTVQKPAADWPRVVQGVNAKPADIDGNGIVTDIDFSKFQLNIGSSAGTYSPKLSDTNSLSQLQFDIADTILMKVSDSGKIRVPIRIQNPSSIVSYGLGLSITVQNKDQNTLQDSFYPKYSHRPRHVDSGLWVVPSNSFLFVEDKKSRANHTNIAYCKTNGINDSLGTECGVIDIIAEEILWGIVNPAVFGRLKLTIKDIAYIDNNYIYVTDETCLQIYLHSESKGISISNE